MDSKPKAPEQKSPREIVKSAVEYYKSVSDNIDVTKLRLEEIVQDDKVWRVTLSYSQQDPDSIFGGSATREYKEFHIDAISGDVKSMTIKKL